MSKAILISIQPKWVEKICNGEKTIEVRKSRPKLETPFKVYIYCTKEKRKDDFITISGAFGLIRCPECAIYNRAKEYDCNGKVIGEFVCDRIICSQAYFDERGKNHLTNVFEEDIKRTCLTEYDLWNYIAGEAVKANQMYDGYLWHISDLKIYDKPKELSEFRKPCPYTDGTHCLENKCEYYDDYSGKCCCRVERPPKSYMYVEEL